MFKVAIDSEDIYHIPYIDSSAIRESICGDNAFDHKTKLNIINEYIFNILEVLITPLISISGMLFLLIFNSY